MKGADFGEARHVSFEGDHPMYPLSVSVQCKGPPEFQLLNMYRDLPPNEHPVLDDCTSVEHWLELAPPSSKALAILHSSLPCPS